MKIFSRWYIALFFFTATNFVYAVPPIGFERWTPLPSSYVVFDQTCNKLQTDYNHPGSSAGRSSSTQFPHPGGFQTTPNDNVNREKDFRLIDIEVRRDHFTGINVIDAVVVTNTGSFKRKSWLLCGLTQTNVSQWSDIQGLEIVDVERYLRNGFYRWAIIVQEDPFNLKSKFIPSASLADINFIAGAGEEDEFWRVLDIDHLLSVGGCDPEEACVLSLYSALMVENVGENYVLWNLKQGWSYQNLVPGAYQLIDREKAFAAGANWWSAMLSVAVDNDYSTLEFLSQSDVQFYNHSSFGIVIDLEWSISERLSNDILKVYDWYTVNSVP